MRTVWIDVELDEPTIRRLELVAEASAACPAPAPREAVALAASALLVGAVCHTSREAGRDDRGNERGAPGAA